MADRKIILPDGKTISAPSELGDAALRETIRAIGSYPQIDNCEVFNHPDGSMEFRQVAAHKG